MLTASEFAKWFVDYRLRFPAVGDYVDRQELPSKLLDNWHQSLSAFDSDVLEAVTDGIVAGRWEPVENVKLGVFGAEIRRLCREVLDARRDGQHRHEWQTTAGGRYTPLMDGRMVDMFCAAEAVRVLVGNDKCGDIRHGDDVHADRGPLCAAIILADDHTAYEAEQCRTKLAEFGLTWEQVQQLATRLRSGGVRPFHTPEEADGQAPQQLSLAAEEPQPVAVGSVDGFPPEQSIDF
jgi:hypothetical protein